MPSWQAIGSQQTYRMIDRLKAIELYVSVADSISVLQQHENVEIDVFVKPQNDGGSLEERVSKLEHELGLNCCMLKDKTVKLQ